MIVDIVLGRSHATRADGMCVAEAVACLFGEPHSDHPAGLCPVLGAFVRPWGDALDDADRNRLLAPFVRRLVGTKSTAAVEEQRAWLATAIGSKLRAALLARRSDHEMRVAVVGFPPASLVRWAG